MFSFRLDKTLILYKPLTMGMVNGRIAIYARVSTGKQDLETQVSQLQDYAASEYGVETPELFKDESTGTDTDRSGYDRLMSSLDDYDAVVFRSVSRVARSIRDLSDTVERFEAADTALDFANEPISFDPAENDPYNRAMLQLLGVFAELEANMIQSRIKESMRQMKKEGFKFGRAPLGFDKNNGELVPDDDFDAVCATLEMVDDGELSKRKAAARLDTSRATIRRALDDADRRDLYALP